MGSEHTRADTTSQHHLLRMFRLVLSAPKQAKGSKDPSSSLQVELQPLALAGASCLLALAWLCSLNTLAPGQVWQVRALKGNGKRLLDLQHVYTLSPLFLQKGLWTKQIEEGKKDKNGISGGKKSTFSRNYI